MTRKENVVCLCLFSLLNFGLRTTYRSTDQEYSTYVQRSHRTPSVVETVVGSSGKLWAIVESTLVHRLNMAGHNIQANTKTKYVAFTVGTSHGGSHHEQRGQVCGTKQCKVPETPTDGSHQTPVRSSLCRIGHSKRQMRVPVSIPK